MTTSKLGQSLSGPLPRWATPIYSRFFNEFMPLLCYAFYLYAQSIRASNHYDFKVKALKFYAFCDLCPKCKVYYTVEPFFQPKIYFYCKCGVISMDSTNFILSCVKRLDRIVVVVFRSNFPWFCVV